MLALLDGDLFCMRTAFGFEGLPLHKATSSLDAWIDRTIDKSGSDRLDIFIQGEGNFRDEIATIKPYKGQRKNEKPMHLHDLREHLLDKYCAIQINGKETDDALGIRQTQCIEDGTDSCIVSYDKDLKMIPGFHHDPRNHTTVGISKKTADYNFWLQVLQGDRADNIPGIKGVGPARADSILSASFGSNPDMRDKIYNAYTKYVAKLMKLKGIEEDDEEVIDETIHMWVDEVASLLWIQRWNCETWHGLFHS